MGEDIVVEKITKLSSQLNSIQSNYKDYIKVSGEPTHLLVDTEYFKFMKKENLIEKLPKVKILVVPRFGRTRFEFVTAEENLVF